MCHLEIYDASGYRERTVYCSDRRQLKAWLGFIRKRNQGLFSDWHYRAHFPAMFGAEDGLVALCIRTGRAR